MLAFRCYKGDRGATRTLKWFQAGKGFGFISVDGGGADVFVHQTAIRCDDFRELRENQRVEFDVMQGQKGLQAADSDATG